MKPVFILFFVALAVVFAAFNQVFLAGACAIAAGLALLAFFLSGAGRAAAGTGKALAKDVWTDLEKAETSGFEAGIAEEGIKNAASMTGQQLYAKDKHQFKYKGWAGIGDACQKLIDLFKKAFK